MSRLEAAKEREAHRCRRTVLHCRLTRLPSQHQH